MDRKTSEVIAFAVLRAAAFVVVLPVLLIVYFLVQKGAPALSWKFLTTMPANGMTEGGILSPIVGTLYLVICTAAIALPLGLVSAIYLSEYAKPGFFTRMVRMAIVNLAGVPSVVYGLFGYGVFVLLLSMGVSIIAGSLTLALLILPVVIVSAEEALVSVPQSFREASLALGATKWQTIRRAVLPNALPGIITGTILGIGRAAGETAPIMFTVAVYWMPTLPRSIADKCMALPYHLYVLATQVSNAPPQIQWGTALTLLIVVLGMNLGAALLRSHYRRKRVW
ncbi:MAG: phosphate ABC transporter permease PstA [Armatimonadetes bacterium]|nr:phosphate ABC transporter permease PstA [Armatimonadota bacterium]